LCFCDCHAYTLRPHFAQLQVAQAAATGGKDSRASWDGQSRKESLLQPCLTCVFVCSLLSPFAEFQNCVDIEMQHKAVIGFENIIEIEILDTRKIVEHIIKTL